MGFDLVPNLIHFETSFNVKLLKARCRTTSNQVKKIITFSKFTVFPFDVTFLLDAMNYFK